MDFPRRRLHIGYVDQIVEAMARSIEIEAERLCMTVMVSSHADNRYRTVPFHMAAIPRSHLRWIRHATEWLCFDAKDVAIMRIGLNPPEDMLRS